MSNIFNELVIEKHNLCRVSFELCIISTKLINTFSILSFSDFQESHQLNKIIFDFAFERFNDLGYNISNTLSICCGDMYGESFYDANGKRIEIKGKNGIPNYEIYNRTKLFYFVYGNHDLVKPNITINDNMIHLNKLYLINNENITISGVDGIKSSKNKLPGYNNKYDEIVNSVLKHKPYIFVTHETPLINDIDYNPRHIGNANLMNSIKKYKPTIHFFGHCHFNKPIYFDGNTLFVNCDSRFVLILPE
jgi:Icc-related predicted phosphoesterase